LRPFQNSPDRSGIAARSLAQIQGTFKVPCILAQAAAIRTDSGPFHCDEGMNLSLLKKQQEFIKIIIMKKILLFVLCVVAVQNLAAQLADFTFEDVEGNSHHLYEYLENDKLVVLEFFFTDCGFCANFAPTLDGIYEETGLNQEDVIVLSMEVQNATSEEIIDWKETTNSAVPVCGGDGPWNYWADNVYPILQGNFEQIIVLAPSGDSHEMVFSGTRLGLNGTVQDLRDAIAANRAGTTNTAIGEVGNFEWSVAPNPAHQQVILEIETLDNSSPLSVNLYDLTGNLVLSRLVEQSQVNLSLEGLAVGNYVVELVQEGKRERKVVVVW